MTQAKWSTDKGRTVLLQLLSHVPVEDDDLKRDIKDWELLGDDRRHFPGLVFG
jgi:hypothetical protein